MCCVRCPWPHGACSPVCAPSVLFEVSLASCRLFVAHTLCGCPSDPYVATTESWAESEAPQRSCDFPPFCACLLLAKPVRCTLDNEGRYKTKTGSTSSVNLVHTPPPLRHGPSSRSQFERLSTCTFLWCVVCAVSLAYWRLFTGVRAWCAECAVSMAYWRLFTSVRAWCVVCAVSLASWRLFTGVRAWCALCAVSMAS